MTQFALTSASLHKIWTDFQKLKVRSFVQKILFEISKEVTKTAIGYPEDIIGVNHENRPLTLTQWADLINFRCLVLLVILIQYIQIVIQLIRLLIFLANE